MRIHRYMWVVFVRLRTGEVVIHDTAFSHRKARKAFKDAEKRTDCDRIQMECFVRNPPLGTRTWVQARTFKRLTESFGFKVTEGAKTNALRH